MHANQKLVYFVVKNFIKMKTNVLYAFAGMVLISCSGGTKEIESNENKTEIQQEKSQTADSYTAFVEEVLIGFPMKEVSKHMVQTPYKYLGETEGRATYEGQDENKVDHFVTFGRYFGDELQVIVYNLDFKNNNEKLVMDYQKKLLNKLVELYGDTYDPGYNEAGNYVIDWVMEFGTVSLTHGVNFVTYEVRTQ
jgi:hypothetical protein